MYGIRVAKEVVHVAQNLLVGTYEEHAYIIVFARPQLVERYVVRLVVMIDVGSDLAIGVA